MLKKEPAQIDLFACAMRLTAALTYYLLKHTTSHAETKYEGCQICKGLQGRHFKKV